jgi:hypothetical protein
MLFCAKNRPQLGNPMKKARPEAGRATKQPSGLLVFVLFASREQDDSDNERQGNEGQDQAARAVPAMQTVGSKCQHRVHIIFCSGRFRPFNTEY